MKKKKTSARRPLRTAKTKAWDRIEAHAAKERIAARLNDPAAVAYRERFGVTIHIPPEYVKPTMAAIDLALGEQAKFQQAESEKRKAIEAMFEQRKGPAWKMFLRMLNALKSLMQAQDDEVKGEQPGCRAHDFSQLVEEAAEFVNASAVEGED